MYVFFSLNLVPGSQFRGCSANIKQNVLSLKATIVGVSTSSELVFVFSCVKTIKISHFCLSQTC